jgi:hypothetical protein
MTSGRPNIERYLSAAEKRRAYQVQMYALNEERRVCGMTDEIYAARHREIIDNCFPKKDGEKR